MSEYQDKITNEQATAGLSCNQIMCDECDISDTSCKSISLFIKTLCSDLLAARKERDELREENKRLKQELTAPILTSVAGMADNHAKLVAERDRADKAEAKIREMREALRTARKFLPSIDALPYKTETEVGNAAKLVDKALESTRGYSKEEGE